MASFVVFKVKYEDTLRRFTAAVNENQQMELDIDILRAKIRSLFNFTADADLKLTYIDEDQDIVALVDQADLYDVVRQGLNPVRITVQVNTGKFRSSGTSTPVPTRDNNLNPNMNVPVAELLKSVPEPLREPISNLYSDVASKAASTSPALTDLVQSIARVSHSFLNAHHCPSPQSGDVDEVAANKVPIESQNKPPEVNNASALLERAFQEASCNMSKLIDDKCNEGGSSSVKGTTHSAASKVEKIPSADTNEDTSTNRSTECPFGGLPIPVFPERSLFGLHKAKSFGPTEGAIFHRGVICDGCGVHPITGPRFKSTVKEDYDLCRICFLQMGNDADYVRIDFPAPNPHPWSFRGSQTMNPRPWAHRPPPPFCGKHIKQIRSKLDSRFISDVNVLDGTMMAPLTHFTKVWRMRNVGNLPWTKGTQLLWIGGDKFSPTNVVEVQVPRAGLNPDQEIDVAVDFIAPELPGRYVSYWKMASSSGHKFGQRIWVVIQVDASLTEAKPAVSTSLNLNLPPEEGAVEDLPQSLDIVSVDQTPLINVEYEPSPVGPTTKTQTPLCDEQQKSPRCVDGLQSEAFALTPATSSSAPPLPAPSTQDLSSVISYPTIEPRFFCSVPVSSSAAHVEPSSSQVETPQQHTEPNNEVEEVLLKELEEMGFKQVDLNKEVLRRNDYNFEQALDELCSVSEWDLLLEELQGMGFVDREANMKVLAKNNGSLKLAVMDLITRENV